MLTILYTGARSGIASSVINKFKNDNNYFIYVSVHTDNELKEIKNKYQNWNNIKCLKLDVTNDSDLNQLNNLDIDILICNAALNNSGSVLDIKIDKFIENFDVNVFSNIKLIQMQINKLKKVIIISSIAGMLPIPFDSSYCATKASLIKIAECLKYELKILNKDIKVSLIIPGLYKTGFNNYMFDNKYSLVDENYFKDIINKIRLNENTLLIFEKKNFSSISNKIYKAITLDNPKFIYKAPISQAIFAKLYMLFKE